MLAVILVALEQSRISRCAFHHPVSTELWLQPSRPFSHFSGLVHYIEQMIVTGKPAYPVERTLLTTGALAALMDPCYLGHRRLEIPHLNVTYRAPKELLYSRGPVPGADRETHP